MGKRATTCDQNMQNTDLRQDEKLSEEKRDTVTDREKVAGKRG